MSEGTTLVEQAYAIIRQDILGGKLEPESPLRIDRLKDDYAIGASPLREALSRLLSDGLVTSEGLRGFRVAPASLEDLRDITDVRKILECAALQLSITRGDQEWEGKLVLAHYHLCRWSEQQSDRPEESADEMEQLNRNFHQALIGGAKSPHSLRICLRLYDLSRRYRQISMSVNPKRVGNVGHEHNAIFKATLRRDAKTAMRLLSHHIEETYRSVSKAFELERTRVSTKLKAAKKRRVGI